MTLRVTKKEIASIQWWMNRPKDMYSVVDLQTHKECVEKLLKRIVKLYAKTG